MPYFATFLIVVMSMAQLAADPLRQIQEHLIIGDAVGAVALAKESLQEAGDSEDLQRALVRSLAAAGKGREALDRCAEGDEDLIEEIAWAYMHEASTSPALKTRLFALIGAVLSQDMRGVALLRTGMHDRNQRVRRLAIELAGYFPDTLLVDELLELLEVESGSHMRQAMISSLGKQKSPRARHALAAILSREGTPAPERRLATEALVAILDDVPHRDVLALASSERSGMRLLACRLVQDFELSDDLDKIAPLVHDPHPDIRIAAIEAVVFLGNGVADLKESLQDIDPRVRAVAAWGLLLQGMPEGESYLLAELHSRDVPSQRLAAMAIARAGESGLPLMLAHWAEVHDPYARLSLAIGLIGHAKERPAACKALVDIISRSNERWGWKQVGHVLGGIGPQAVSGGPGQAHTMDQLTRLRLLHVLAQVSPEEAIPAMESFLQSRRWQVTGAAALEVLAEGSDEAVVLLGELLKSPHPRIRVQAALLMAMWGRDPEARLALEEAYHSSDREVRERILEGLGYIGSRESLPLLRKAMRDPFQNLRLIAASAVIQTINR